MPDVAPEASRLVNQAPTADSDTVGGMPGRRMD